jgi:hypothetical protein
VVERRGDFPFDLMEWIHERLDLEDRCVFSIAFTQARETDCGAIHGAV